MKTKELSPLAKLKAHKLEMLSREPESTRKADIAALESKIIILKHRVAYAIKYNLESLEIKQTKSLNHYQSLLKTL